MKSVRYLIMGRPTKMDDCLDLCGKRPATRVAVDLEVDDFVGDQAVITELIAQYSWRFGSLQATCEEVCGRYSTSDDRETRQRRVDQANERLRRSLERLKKHGIEVCNGQGRFSVGT